MMVSPGMILAEGRYRLVARIAVGGMGEVWRSHDLMQDAPVAIKVLRSEYTGDITSLRRLRIEAHNASLLDHPNIATVFDYREEQGTGYLVMEYVDGQSMADVLATHGSIAPLRLLPILIQASMGLNAAHAAGVIHRDVKPGNILLGPADQVKLTDFGISVAHGQMSLTDTGKVMGTAQYLAPEQALGNPATPAGDLYALGIIAYEALTGERPFTGQNHVAIALAQVQQMPAPLPRSVEPTLAALVMSLLEKDPQARPPSGWHLAQALGAVMATHRKLGSTSLTFLRASPFSGAAARPGVDHGRTVMHQIPGPSDQPSPPQDHTERHGGAVVDSGPYAPAPNPEVYAQPETTGVASPPESQHHTYEAPADAPPPPPPPPGAPLPYEPPPQSIPEAPAPPAPSPPPAAPPPQPYAAPAPYGQPPVPEPYATQPAPEPYPEQPDFYPAEVPAPEPYPAQPGAPDPYAVEAPEAYTTEPAAEPYFAPEAYPGEVQEVQEEQLAPGAPTEPYPEPVPDMGEVAAAEGDGIGQEEGADGMFEPLPTITELNPEPAPSKRPGVPYAPLEPHRPPAPRGPRSAVGASTGPGKPQGRTWFARWGVPLIIGLLFLFTIIAGILTALNDNNNQSQGQAPGSYAIALQAREHGIILDGEPVRSGAPNTER
jgi:serine/threonine-protein kinase